MESRCLLALEAWTHRAALIAAEEEREAREEEEGGARELGAVSPIESAASACFGIEVSQIGGVPGSEGERGCDIDRTARPRDRLESAATAGRRSRSASATAAEATAAVDRRDQHELLSSTDEDGESDGGGRRTKRGRKRKGKKKSKRSKRSR